MEVCSRVHPACSPVSGVESILVRPIVIDVFDDVHLMKKSCRGSARLEVGP